MAPKGISVKSGGKRNYKLMPWESKHLSDFILIFIYMSCYLKAPAKLNSTYRFFCEIMSEQNLYQFLLNLSDSPLYF